MQSAIHQVISRSFSITVRASTGISTYTTNADSSCDAWLAAAELCDCTQCAISVTSKAAQ